MKRTLVVVLALAFWGYFVPVASAESAKDMLDPMISTEPQESADVSASTTDTSVTVKAEETKSVEVKKSKGKSQDKSKDKSKEMAKEKKQKKSPAKKSGGSSKHIKTKKRTLPQ